MVAKEFYYGDDKKRIQKVSDAELDILSGIWDDILEPYEDIPRILVTVEKSAMQRVLEEATPEKILAYEAHNELIYGARAVKIKDIDPDKG
jgi:hypothetical protein